MKDKDINFIFDLADKVKQKMIKIGAIAYLIEVYNNGDRNSFNIRWREIISHIRKKYKNEYSKVIKEKDKVKIIWIRDSRYKVEDILNEGKFDEFQDLFL